MDTPTCDALYGRAACGLMLTSTDGTIRRVNATFCTWASRTEDELLDKRFQDLLTIGGRVFHQTHWAPLMQMQGSVSEVKLDLLCPSGEPVPILANAIRRRHGKEVFDEIAIMVATERQKYERELLLARRAAEGANERLAQDDRRKDEFLATLAHELRGPLAPMSNVLEVLRHKTIDDPEIAWSREVLGRQLNHVTRLVEDLLEVSRITQGKMRLRLAPLPLNEAIERAVEAALPLVEAAQQQLVVALAEEPMWLEADLARVTQAVLNLLVNASKFTPAGGRIEISTMREGAMATCTVRDWGIGIDAAHLGSVFEMFSQAEPALERTTGGLGIGLALVRGLIELHGGSVHAHSPGLGHGSSFVVRLPLSEARAEPVDTSAAPIEPQQHRTVLVVDDNVDSAASLALLLSLDGHTTRAVHDGQAALDAIEDGAFDAVLLDLGLPGLNGFEVARRLRSTANGQALLLIATTGWGQQKDVEATSAAGFDHHLVKPVDLTALGALLAAPKPE